MAKKNFLDGFGDMLGKGARSVSDRFTKDVTDLIRAVQKNDVDGVARMLRAGKDPNVPDGINRLALPLAVDNNKTEIVKLLLLAKADPNVEDKDGQSALFKAVSWENHEITQLLVEAGADMNKISTADGQTPYQHAEDKRYKDILTILLGVKKIDVDGAIKKREAENKAELEALEKEAMLKNRVEDDKAKHAALKAKAEKARQLKALAEKEQLLKAQQAAQQKQELETAKVNASLEGKYDIKEDNYLTALIQAIKNKDNEATKNFLGKVKDLNAFDATHKTTVLAYVVEQKLNKLSNFLLEKGADPFLQHAEMEVSPIATALAQGDDLFVRRVMELKPEPLKALVTNETQVSSYLNQNTSNPKMFDVLLEAGADINFGGTENGSPVLNAIQNGSLSILPVLVQNEIDLNLIVKEKTLLVWAMESNKSMWVVGLLKEGANPDKVDANSMTPLMHAVRLNNATMAEILLEEKADPTLKNNEGQTAMDMAKALGDRDDLIKLLS